MEVNVVPLNTKYFKENTGEVAVVPSEFWADLIENGKSFKWVKVNHGIFDIIKRIPNVDKLSSKEIATKMYPYRHPRNNKVPRNVYIDIMDKFISNVRNYDDLPPNYYIGINDDNGLNSTSEGKRHKTVMDIIKNGNERTLLHGGLIRRYAVSNDMNKILDAIKKGGYKIHVIGPQYCAHYKKFLGEFNHIVIPTANALANLDKIVEVSKNSLSGKDIFFTSLTTGTFLFLDKFKEENTTVIDVGRAFDYLIKEHKSVQYQAWLRPLNSRGQIETRNKFYDKFIKNGYDCDLITHTIKKTSNF